MKFLLALALAGLVSCIGATPFDSRHLQIEDSFWAGDPSVVLGLNDTAFNATFPHNDADPATSLATSFGASGKSYIYLFKTCPHGAAFPNPTTHADYLGTLNGANDPTWISVVTGKTYTYGNVATATGTASGKTTLTFKVLPTVKDEPKNIWTFDDTAATDVGTATFCVWFGIGPSGGSQSEVPYGFREMVLTAKFNFASAFPCIGLTTQAYDPITGGVNTTKTYTCEATICSDQPYARPGVKVCVQLCPDDDSGTLVNVTDVPDLYQCPGTVTGDAVGGYTVTDPNGVQTSMTSTSTWNILPTSSGLDAITQFGVGIGNGCSRVWYDLPSTYYTTIGGESPPLPSIANPSAEPELRAFGICGTCTIRPVAGSGAVPVNPCDKTTGKGCKKTAANQCCSSDEGKQTTSGNLPATSGEKKGNCEGKNGNCFEKYCCNKAGFIDCPATAGPSSGGFKICKTQPTSRRSLLEDLGEFELMLKGSFNRMLQDSSNPLRVEDSAPVSGTLRYLVPPEEESSSNAVGVATAAVAAAVGAALMI